MYKCMIYTEAKKNKCRSCNPTDPSDLQSNIAHSKLFISKMSNKFFQKDKIFQMSCLKNPCDDVSCIY